MKQLLFFLAFIGFFFTSPGQKPAIVKAVHDGDSYRVEYLDGRKVWVRLWGTDCPEIISNHITADQDFGRAAGNLVREMIKGKTVMVDSVRTDLYGRTVARITLEGGQDLTQVVIFNGWGWWFNNSRISSGELDILKDLQRKAQESKSGLWALPGRKIRPGTFRSQNWRQ